MKINKFKYKWVFDRFIKEGLMERVLLRNPSAYDYKWQQDTPTTLSPPGRLWFDPCMKL